MDKKALQQYIFEVYGLKIKIKNEHEFVCNLFFLELVEKNKLANDSNYISNSHSDNYISPSGSHSPQIY